LICFDELLAAVGEPDFIKIDVEGAEASVLQGGSKVLRDARPGIYLEVGQESGGQVAELLHAADYLLLDPSRAVGADAVIPRCRFNTLALPRERVERADRA